MSAQRTLGRYTLLRRLAAGGMGEVYLAETQGAANFTKRVAIKRILPHLARNEDFVHKFIDEAHLMVQLHHGNIVPVLELADDEGELYLVMEYLPGRDLKAVLRRLRAEGLRMAPDLAVWLVAEVCAGLDYAHRKVAADGRPLNIVHRDVSPSNVALGAGGEVKLVDFGIARARGGLHQSISGTLQGKFVYMSPEQADGRPVDPRSDVFSAGLVLYELLTGVRPFEGDSETETLRLVRQAAIEPPSTVAPHLPAGLDALVMRALAPAAEDRYPTAGDMRRALSRWLVEHESHADASALARALAEWFPEGVVPDAESAAPLSLDDALMMQLGALTPSADGLARTRTATAEGVERGAPRSGPPTPASPPTPQRRVTDAAVDPLDVTAAPPADRPLARGRRRFLFVGLLLGALAAAGVGLWLDRPTSSAARAALDPAVTPDGVPFRTLVNGGEVSSLPFPLKPGEDYVVCVEADAHDAKPRCRTLVASEGTHRPAFALLPRPADAAPPPDVGPPADAAFLPDATVDARPPRDAARRRPPIAAPPAVVTLASTPTVANVFAEGAQVGTTPFPVTVGRRAQRFELRATGFAPTAVNIPPGTPAGEKVVTLQQFAKLTVRAHPGAAVLVVDGQRVGQPGVLNAHPLPPGRHRVEALWTHPETRTVHRSEPVTVTLEAGKLTVLPEIRVPLPPGVEP